VYWHVSDECKINVDLDANHARLYKQPGKAIKITKSKYGVILPVNDRHYLETELSRAQVTEAFQKAKIITSSGLP
jgi:hypothetical protein